MPFTGSHPAAVLPLPGHRIPASALVIGSLVPDLPYYLPVPVHVTLTHAWRGALGIDVVFGVALFLLWHLVLVPPLLWLAPGEVQRRVPGSMRNGGRITNAADLGVVCLGLVIGGLTHVALDMVTHDDMWPVMRIQALSTPMAGFALYRWLHLGLSVAGLALLAWYVRRWWRSAPLVGTVSPVAAALRWGGACLLLAISCLAGLCAALPWTPEASLAASQDALIAGIIGFFSALSLAALAGAMVWHAALALGVVRPPAG